MPKTKEIEIRCDEARIKSNRYGFVTVIAEDPKIDELISGIHKDDILEWILGEGFNPEEIFTNGELDKWAEENGYVKDNSESK